MTSRFDRRLAAILAIDVVAYSRLVEADEGGTLARVRAHRVDFIEPLIVEHRGLVVKLTGDGALVEFASAVDAVECAVAIQKAIAGHEAAEPEERRIRYRIGINIGDVIHEDGDIFGDGVNVAVRLEGLAEPGGICISRSLHDQVRAKVACGFEPRGSHRVKNIAEPVELWRIRLNSERVRALRPLIPSGGRGRRAAAILAATVTLIAAVAAATGYALWRPAVVHSTGSASIAVLPFDNLSGDERADRLADGITEDIITDLARFRDLDVIARNSTIGYKGKSTDVREIARALDVGYVLEGSIQYQGDRLRVNAQLIDTHTGAHVWSERWDRPAMDFFAVQSAIAEHVAAKLGGALNYGVITAAEVQRIDRREPASLTAYEHYLIAAKAKSQGSEDIVRQGIAHAQQAIELDPKLARAYTVRGWLNYFMISFGEHYETAFANAGNDFEQALMLDPLDGEAHASRAFWLAQSGSFVQAVAEARRAIALAPSHIHVLVSAGSALAFAGQIDEALQVANRAVRLDPNMPSDLLRGVKDIFFFARDFERTIEAVEKMPDEVRSRGSVFMLAASYALLGQTGAEAKAAKNAFIARYGDASAELWLNQGWIFGRRDERDLFIGSFRRLGLPICASEEHLAQHPAMKRLETCSGA